MLWLGVPDAAVAVLFKTTPKQIAKCHLPRITSLAETLRIYWGCFDVSFCPFSTDVVIDLLTMTAAGFETHSGEQYFPILPQIGSAFFDPSHIFLPRPLG